MPLNKQKQPHWDAPYEMASRFIRLVLFPVEIGANGLMLPVYAVNACVF